jgi:hypothetical protein
MGNEKRAGDSRLGNWIEQGQNGLERKIRTYEPKKGNIVKLKSYLKEKEKNG